MYCPKCGKENAEHQKFCTSCGLKLAAVSTAIASGSQPMAERAVGVIGSVGRGWQAPLLYAFVLIASGALISVLGNKVLAEKSLGDIGIMVSFAGFLVLSLKGLLLVVQSSTSGPRSTIPAAPELEDEQRQADFHAAKAPALLSAEPPSITEHTTRQLESSTQDESERPRTTQPTLQ